MQTETGNMRWKSWRQNSTLIFSAKSSTTVVFKNCNWQRLVGSHFFPNKLRDIGVNWKHPAGPLFLVMVCQHVTPSQKSSLTFSERGTLCMWEWELCVNVCVCVCEWVWECVQKCERNLAHLFASRIFMFRWWRKRKDAERTPQCDQNLSFGQLLWHCCKLLGQRVNTRGARFEVLYSDSVVMGSIPDSNRFFI